MTHTEGTLERRLDAQLYSIEALVEWAELVNKLADWLHERVTDHADVKPRPGKLTSHGRDCHVCRERAIGALGIVGKPKPTGDETATRGDATVLPETLSALKCAETVLILLKDEVDALGFNAGNVLSMVRAAIKAGGGQ